MKNAANFMLLIPRIIILSMVIHSSILKKIIYNYFRANITSLKDRLFYQAFNSTSIKYAWRKILTGSVKSLMWY